MLNPSGQGFTFSNIYDPNLGVLTGLSSTTNTTQANLASLSFTINGLLGAFNDQTSTGSALATETFSYDGDLRPSEETTTWQSGSGSSGTFFDEARGYDAASNVDTVTTTLSQPNGQSGTNSEVQNFCYDEQNELVWAGNSGTQPPAGNGTCGSETLSNTFTGANYNTAFVYTHLGQLWQGPLNGTGANEQYLYCNSSQPHQLTDMVPAGQNYSCTNLPQTIPYALPTYDSFGNATSRTTSAGTATLSYNSLDQMVEWQLPNTNQAWYGYDAGGTRTIQHTTIGSTSATTIYAFGLEEYSYDGSGALLSSTHYYSLAGHLLGELQVAGSNSTTNFFLTDGLGSVLGVFSDTANSAALLSTQLFTPYGAQLVSNGNSIGQYTTKGFTGQYSDAVSGLDYYVSRYYDPVSGVFLSADALDGNLLGMNPYGYVGNNPETFIDPTGAMYVCPGGCGGGSGVSYGPGPTQTLSPPSQVDPNNPLTWQKLNPSDPAQNPWANPIVDDPELVAEGGVAAGLCPWCLAIAGVAAIGLTLLTPETLGNADMIPPWQGEPITSPVYHDQPIAPSPYDSPVYHDAPVTGPTITQTGGGSGKPPGGKYPPTAPASAPCSFTSNTPVATANGEQSIGKLHVGEKVRAYNPQTHKMENEPILHVWIHQDNDLVDLTMTTKIHAPHSTVVTTMRETIHTNKKHPFFTLEKGFVPVEQLKLGMHVLRADGRHGVITGYRVVPGSAVMYNLDVAQDHTFTIGIGQWVVHNCNPNNIQNARALSAALRTTNAFIDHLTPSDLSGAWNDLHGNPIPNSLGGFYNHLEEVQYALASGQRTLSIFSDLLDRGVLSEEDQCIVECLYGRISRTMDYAENIMYRNVWTPGANVLEWWSP